MKVAITVWEDRISPLCDSARQFLVVSIRRGRVVSEERIPARTGGLQSLVSGLVSEGIDVLICGAVSESLSALLDRHSIRVIPFVSGQVSHILNAFCGNRLDQPEYRMPGFGRGRKRHFRRRPGGGRGRAGNLFNL